MGQRGSAEVEQKFIKNAVWNASGSMIYLAGQWLVTVMVTRFFGYDDAGVLSLAMSISGSFQSIALWGIRNFQISDNENKYSDSNYTMMRGLTCIVSLVACMIFTYFNHYSEAQIEFVFWYMMFRLSESYSDVFQGIAQKNERLDVAGKGFALKGILMLSVFVIGQYYDARLNVCLALVAVSAWMVTLLYDFVVTEKIIRFSLVSNITKSVMLCRETVPLCVYFFLNSTVSALPKYILEKMCDSGILGVYSSISAPTIIIQAATAYIYTPFVGKLAQLYNNNEYKKFWLLVIKIMSAIIAIGIVCIVGAAVIGDYILGVIFGESILQYSSLLFLVIIATICIALGSFVYMLEVVIRDFKNLIIGCCIGFICTLIFSPIMITLFGADGTSIGIIISSMSSVIYVLVTMVLALKKTEKRFVKE